MPESAVPRGYILAFDFGLRRIGVAVGQTTTQTATALRTVSNGPEPDWAAVDRLVAEWRPQLLVVGLPVTRILETAEKIEARMIVMGSQGRTGLKHIMLGSKAEQVVNLSPIPVTIVKAKKEKSESKK